MTSWQPFPLRHSHGRNFASIVSKILHKIENCLPLIAIQNQRDGLVTSANMADCVFEKKFKMAANFSFLFNKASEVSISTEIDLLVTNMIISSQLDASFPVKVAKYHN